MEEATDEADDPSRISPVVSVRCRCCECEETLFRNRPANGDDSRSRRMAMGKVARAAERLLLPLLLLRPPAEEEKEEDGGPKGGASTLVEKPGRSGIDACDTCVRLTAAAEAAGERKAELPPMMEEPDDVECGAKGEDEGKWQLGGGEKGEHAADACAPPIDGAGNAASRASAELCCPPADVAAEYGCCCCCCGVENEVAADANAYGGGVLLAEKGDSSAADDAAEHTLLPLLVSSTPSGAASPSPSSRSFVAMGVARHWCD